MHPQIVAKVEAACRTPQIVTVAMASNVARSPYTPLPHKVIFNIS